MTEISGRTQHACDIAAGRIEADQSAQGTSIAASKKDLNSKGNGEHWYRMVYRSGSWQYVTDERLPTGSYLASDRRCTLKGDVFEGELIVRHDRGAPVDKAWLILADTNNDGLVCKEVEFAKRRDGNLAFTLPTADVIVLPNPRK